MRTTTRHILVGILAFVLSATVLTSPSLANERDELERQQRGVNSQLNSARDNLNHSTQELNAAISAFERAQAELSVAEQHLADTRGQLSVARAYDAQMQAELEVAEADLARAERDLVEGGERADDAEADIRRYTLESLQAPDPGLQAFGLLLQGEEPRSFSERMAITRSVNDTQVARLGELQASRVWLEVQRGIVQDLRDEVQVKREEAAANLIHMQELEAQAAAREQEVADLVDRRASAQRQAESSRAADQRAVRELEAERNRLAAEIRALRETPSGNAPNPDGNGTLARPVEGPITSHFGWRTHPIWGDQRLHAGTDFGAPCGRAIYAAASGTIIQQGWAGGYGNRIVINHGTMRGSHVATTYSHLSGFARSNGSSVSRGQLIGYVGTTGSSTGCHLHFEVMQNGNYVNPMGWL